MADFSEKAAGNESLKGFQQCDVLIPIPSDSQNQHDHFGRHMLIEFDIVSKNYLLKDV